MSTLQAYVIFLLLIGCERLWELRLSRMHAAASMSRGGKEFGQGHYPPMVVLHTALLIGAPLEAWLAHRPFIPALGFSMLALVVMAQMLRYWAITTLGDQWNTRVIVVPGADRIRRGPYRWLTHPNYVAVVIEGLALPLIHTSWLTALVFSILNLFLLRVRIRCEDAALAELRHV